MSIFEQLSLAIAELREEEAETLVQRAIAEQLDPVELLNSGVLSGMKIIAKKFMDAEYFLSELVIGGDIAEHCIDLITPHLNTDIEKLGVVVIGTVQGDVHAIGKSLVATQLMAEGYEVHELGVDVPNMTFIEKAREVKADIIGQSSFLTSTVAYTEDLVKYLVDMGLRDNFKVIIGGAAASMEYARRIGADGFAKDCFDAVTLCNELLHSK